MRVIIVTALIVALLAVCACAGLRETVDYSAVMYCVSRVFDIDYDTYISHFDTTEILSKNPHQNELFWAGLSPDAIIRQCDDDGDGRVSFYELNAEPPCLRVPQVQGIVKYVCNPYFGTDYDYDAFRAVQMKAVDIYHATSWAEKIDLYRDQLRAVSTYRNAPRSSEFQQQGMPWPSFTYAFKNPGGSQRAIVMLVMLIIAIITFPCLLLCGCWVLFPTILTIGAATV